MAFACHFFIFYILFTNSVTDSYIPNTNNLNVCLTYYTHVILYTADFLSSNSDFFDIFICVDNECPIPTVPILPLTFYIQSLKI